MKTFPSHFASAGHRAQGVIFPQLGSHCFKKIYGLGNLFEERLHFF